MKLLIIITNLLVIFVALGEGSNKKEDEMRDCFTKLVCELNKFEEFYKITEVGGPELSLQVAIMWSQLIDGKVMDPVDTREYWFQFPDLLCELTDAEKKKFFDEYMTQAGELMLEICRNVNAEMCVRADVAAKELASIFSKYKAMGVCSTEVVPEGPKPPAFG